MNPGCELFDKIISAANKIRKDGNNVYAVFIHPEKAKESGLTATEINGMKILIPHLEDLLSLAIYLGTTSNSSDFWNKENAYLLDKQAYDNIFTKPSFRIDPNPAHFSISIQVNAPQS